MPDEKLSVKELYAEIGNNYRYFLSWRRLIIAGYIGALAGVSVACWSVAPNELLQEILAIATIVLTVFLGLIDSRNRDLYHACEDSGVACEKKLPKDVGFYTRLKAIREVPGSRITQTKALHVLFFIVILACVAVILLKG